MVEFLQPAKKLLAASAKQRHDLMRAQKAVPAEQAQHVRVTRSEFDRRKLFRALKPWMPWERHADILPDTARSSKGGGLWIAIARHWEGEDAKNGARFPRRKVAGDSPRGARSCRPSARMGGRDSGLVLDGASSHEVVGVAIAPQQPTSRGLAFPEWLTQGGPIAGGNRAKSGGARQPSGSHLPRSLSREEWALNQRAATYHVCRGIRPAVLDKGQSVFRCGSRVANHFPNLDFERIRDTKQGVESGFSQLTLDEGNHCRGKPGIFSEAVHGNARLLALLFERADDSRLDAVADGSFWHGSDATGL